MVSFTILICVQFLRFICKRDSRKYREEDLETDFLVVVAGALSSLLFSTAFRVVGKWRRCLISFECCGETATL